MDSSLDESTPVKKKSKTNSPTPHNSTADAILALNTALPESPTGSDLIFMRQDNFTDMMNLIKELKTTIENLQIVVKENDDKTQKKLTNLNDQVKKLKPDAVPTTSGNNVSKTNSNQAITFEKKEQLIPNWGKIFHKRRQLYRKYWHSKTKAAIYDDFINRDNVYIPPKFRPNYARDEDDYSEEEELSIMRLKKEYRTLIKDAKNHQDNYLHVDQKMYDHIEKNIRDPMKSKLLEEWNNEVEKAEPKGRELAEQSLQFIRDLPSEEPYLGFEALQGNIGPTEEPYRDFEKSLGNMRHFRVSGDSNSMGFSEEQPNTERTSNSRTTRMVTEDVMRPGTSNLSSQQSQKKNTGPKKGSISNKEPNDNDRRNTRSTTNSQTTRNTKVVKTAPKRIFTDDSIEDMDTSDWKIAGKRKRGRKPQDFTK